MFEKILLPNIVRQRAFLMRRSQVSVYHVTDAIVWEPPIIRRPNKQGDKKYISFEMHNDEQQQNKICGRKSKKLYGSKKGDCDIFTLCL